MRAAVRTFLDMPREGNPTAIPLVTEAEQIPGQGCSKGTLGAIAELHVAISLMHRGFDVYRPFSPNAKCDLVAVKGYTVLRIEVKTTILKEESFISRSRNRGCIVDHVALVLRTGEIAYRPPLSQHRRRRMPHANKNKSGPDLVRMDFIWPDAGTGPEGLKEV